jgi:hypothetical protein
VQNLKGNPCPASPITFWTTSVFGTGQLRFVAGLVRRARKYYLGVSIISQQANDFLRSDYGRAIASQSALRILMRQDTTTIKNVVSEFNLSEYEQSFLLTCERGDALLTLPIISKLTLM